MKLLSFTHENQASFGATDGSGVCDLGRASSHLSLKAAITANGLDDLSRMAHDLGYAIPFSDISFLQPIPDPDMIICVGMNYRSAFEEIGGSFPGKPSLFMRRPSAQAAHLEPLAKPVHSDQYDCEAEVALIIGREGRNISEDDAMNFVAGFSIFNDGSAVDWMRHTKLNVTPGKNFDRSGAFGPWMVTPDEIADPLNMKIVHRLNGDVLQQGSTSEMHFTFPQLVSYISSFTTLLPGDVISTGSPGGIRSRREAGVYLKPGDRLEMEVEGIGRLENTVS